MNRLLIIDDDAFVRDMLVAALAREGYEVFIAENGEEGLERVTVHQPQVIILDLKMPKMGGVEFLQRLKPEVMSPYSVIVLTGDGSDNDAEQCYQLGIQSFLRKPVNLRELRGLVKRSFELIRFSSELQEQDSAWARGAGLYLERRAGAGRVDDRND